jgi:hypothetical protein
MTERCKTCVLPTSYSEVTFDSSGTCNLCRQARQPDSPNTPAHLPKQESSELLDLIDKARKQKGPYDCLVPLSGGQDSAYVAYLLARHHNLKILGVNFDNGYRSPLAIANMESISQSLGISLITLKLNSSLLHRLYRHFFASCGYFCTVCNAIGYVTIASFVARQKKITGINPLVAGGWSKKYEYQPGLSVLSMQSFGEILMRDPSLYQGLIEDPLIDPEVLDALIQVGDIRQFCTTEENSRLRLVHLPNHMDWDYRQIAETLQKEFNWQRPDSGKDAHFDCELAPLQDHLKVKRFGFGQMTIKNSVLIRDGHMDRREALNRCKQEQLEEPAILQTILKDWNMDHKDVGWDAKWAE